MATVGMGSAFALLPKCPACVAAYLGLASVAGADLVVARTVFPLVWLGLGLAVLALGYRSLRKRALGPFLLATAGAALLVSTRLEWIALSPAVGIVLLAAGTVWSARLPRRRVSCERC